MKLHRKGRNQNILLQNDRFLWVLKRHDFQKKKAVSPLSVRYKPSHTALENYSKDFKNKYF